MNDAGFFAAEGRKVKSFHSPAIRENQSGLDERSRQIAVAGVAVFIFKPQRLGGAASLHLQRLVLDLRQINELAIMAEIHVAQFGVPVEAERLDDEGLELAGEEIGEEESADVVVPALGEFRIAGEEGIAMRAGDALDTFLLAKPIKEAAGAAIRIGDEDALETIGSGSGDRCAQAGDDFSGVLCQMAGRQFRSI